MNMKFICTLVFLFATVGLVACGDDNCGNGTLDDGEACDGEVFPEGMGMCPSGQGTLMCTSSCALDTSSCNGGGGGGGGTGGGAGTGG